MNSTIDNSNNNNSNNTTPKNILIIAAENSAENYGAQIVEEFKKKNAPVHFFGVGGDKMKEKGVELLIHNEALAVVGIIEVISSILKLKKIMNLLVKAAIQRKADAVILIDYPDFNIRIAKKFKKAGIPVYYYISPTVWAWRYSRVKLLKQYVSHMFIIFPFEIPIFEKEDIPFTYTGHPLVPLIKITEEKPHFRERMGVNGERIMVTLLPGSRKSEVDFLLPEMLKAMESLGRYFDLDIFLLKASGIDQNLIDAHLAGNSIQPTVVMQEEGYNLISASDIVLTTCGTSNLEIAVIGTPFVSVYRVNRLSYFLGKGFVKIDLYSIVNILAGKEVVKELIQDNFTAENIVAEMRKILEHPTVKNKMLEEFREIRDRLSTERNAPEIIFRKIDSDLTSGS